MSARTSIFAFLSACAILASQRALADTVFDYEGTRHQAVHWAHPDMYRVDFEWVYRVKREDRIKVEIAPLRTVQTNIRFSALKTAKAGVREDYEQKTTTEKYDRNPGDRGIDILGWKDAVYGIDLDIAPNVPKRFNPVSYFRRRSTAYKNMHEIARFRSVTSRSWDNDIAAETDMTEHSGDAGTSWGTHTGSYFWKIASDGSYTEHSDRNGATGLFIANPDASARAYEAIPGFFLVDQRIEAPRIVDGHTVIPVATIRRGREIGPPALTTPAPVQTLAQMWYPVMPPPLRGDRVRQTRDALLPRSCRNQRIQRADENDETAWVVDPANGAYEVEHTVLYLHKSVAVCLSHTLIVTRFDVATGELLKTESDLSTLRLVRSRPTARAMGWKRREARFR